MSDIVLVKLDRARLLLSEARDAQDAKQIMDMAHAAEVFARRQKKSEEAISYAIGIRIEAMRLMGEFLKGQEKNPGIRMNGREPGIIGGARMEPPTIPTLASAGISKKESSASQAIADLAKDSPDEFAKLSSGKLSVSQAVKAVRKTQRRASAPIAVEPAGMVTDLKDLSGQKFACIYADPPWQYDNQGTRGSTDNHYSTMTVKQICAMPIASLAAKNAHLHLWVTNGFLFNAPEIFEAWGFQFKSSFVWVKPQIGMGNYWRNSHELLLLGVRGSLTAEALNLKSWIESPRTKHSQKPEEIRALVEKLSLGPRLELFGRRLIDGWTVFGNELRT